MSDGQRKYQTGVSASEIVGLRIVRTAARSVGEVVLLTLPREWAWARGRWPVRGRHELVEEVRGTDYGRNWL